VYIVHNLKSTKILKKIFLQNGDAGNKSVFCEKRSMARQITTASLYLEQKIKLFQNLHDNS